MTRLELFEFEDFPWFPSVIRTGATNLIIVFHKMLGTAPIIASLIEYMHQRIPFQQVVDMTDGIAF